MAKFFDPNYDPRQDAGSSGVEVTDLNPEKAYDTDLRRIAQDDRRSVEDINANQKEIGKFFNAAKVAGAYKTRAGIAEPTLRGKTPRSPAVIDVSAYGDAFGGTVLPSMGDTIGTAGSTNYADKPGSVFGRF